MILTESEPFARATVDREYLTFEGSSFNLGSRLTYLVLSSLGRFLSASLFGSLPFISAR